MIIKDVNKLGFVLIREDYNQLKSFFNLIQYITDKDNYCAFKEKYYPNTDEDEILESFILYLACVFDEFCKLIVSTHSFFNYNIDNNLRNGFNLPINYEIFSTVSPQGKLIHSIYSNFKNEIFHAKNVNELFKLINKLIDKDLKIFKLLFQNNFDSIDEYLCIFLELLVKEDLMPFQYRRTIIDRLSHFFNDFDNLLEFIKNYDSSWFSSKGFFFGIAFSIEKILGKEAFFQKKDIAILQKPIPFIDMSMEEKGLFEPFTFTLNHFESNKSPIYMYISSNGLMTGYEKGSKTINEYYESIFSLFDEMVGSYNLIKSYGISDFIDNKLLYIEIKKLLQNLQHFEEKYIIQKIFDYKNIISISHNNSIVSNSFFEVISEGTLRRQKKFIKTDLLLLCSLKEEFEKNYFKNMDIIIPIDPTHEKHILEIEKFVFPSLTNKGYESSMYFGYFFNVHTMSNFRDHSYFFGQFMFGSNDYGYSGAEYQNFKTLKDYIFRNKRYLNIKSFIIPNQLQRDLHNQTMKEMMISFEKPSPFSCFFDSYLEIDDYILKEEFISALEDFVDSFTKTNVSNKMKKETLENLSEIFFKMIKGFKIQGKDLVSYEKAEEIDLLIQVNPELCEFTDLSKILGHSFIVECKNLKKPVSSSQMTVFGNKIKKLNLRCGILISREGITGESIDHSARRIIRDFAIEGINILVITKDDFFDVIKGVHPIIIIRRAFARFFFKNIKLIDR